MSLVFIVGLTLFYVVSSSTWTSREVSYAERLIRRPDANIPDAFVLAEDEHQLVPSMDLAWARAVTGYEPFVVKVTGETTELLFPWTNLRVQHHRFLGDTFYVQDLPIGLSVGEAEPEPCYWRCVVRDGVILKVTRIPRASVAARTEQFTEWRPTD